MRWKSPLRALTSKMNVELHRGLDRHSCDSKHLAQHGGDRLPSEPVIKRQPRWQQHPCEQWAEQQVADVLRIHLDIRQLATV